MEIIKIRLWHHMKLLKSLMQSYGTYKNYILESNRNGKDSLMASYETYKYSLMKSNGNYKDFLMAL